MARFRRECREQLGAAVHVEFRIDASLVRDDRAGRHPHGIREVLARSGVR